jgi:hypothetical protein
MDTKEQKDHEQLCLDAIFVVSECLCLLRVALKRCWGHQMSSHCKVEVQVDDNDDHGPEKVCPVEDCNQHGVSDGKVLAG